MRWLVVLSSVLLLMNFHVISMANDQDQLHTIKITKKVVSLPASSFLSPSYYKRTCPNLENIIHQKVKAWVQADPTMAPSIIRLHFHDCAVRGCDASILLKRRGSERSAPPSRTLRGFDLIDAIKAEVERQCPKTVSCADILTTAARDATVLAGGPFWEVPFGRKDGRISLASEALRVPHGRENVTQLVDFFAGLGLSFVDLAVLSGVHTIGRCECRSIWDRLYNFNGTRRPDPSMNLNYVRALRKQCRWSSNLVNLDGTTPRVFDVAYYNNLGKKMGLLSTDQSLFSDERTSSVVELMGSQPEIFMSQFAVSMVNLGNVIVGNNRQGEIRRNCNYVN